MLSAMRTASLIVLTTLAISLAACGTPKNKDTIIDPQPAADGNAPAVSQPAASAVTPGQQVFLTNCVRCHTGAGNPPGPNDIILGSDRLASSETFRTFLRSPSSSMMPAFDGNRLKDADVDLLYQYLLKAKGGE